MTHAHGHDVEGESLIPVEAHLAEILGTIEPLAPTELGLGDVLGLVLAEDVAAASPLPRPYQPGRLILVCAHAKTHGIARRSASADGA